jgi:hypothetical protein
VLEGWFSESPRPAHPRPRAPEFAMLFGRLRSACRCANSVMTHVHRTIGLARCTSSPLPPKAGRDLAGSSRRASWSTGRAHTFVIAGREVQQSVQAAGSLVARVAFTFFCQYAMKSMNISRTAQANASPGMEARPWRACQPRKSDAVLRWIKVMA